MANPPHLGELIRESMEDVGWSVTETRLGYGLSLDADAGELRLGQARRDRTAAGAAVVPVR